MLAWHLLGPGPGLGAGDRCTGDEVKLMVRGHRPSTCQWSHTVNEVMRERPWELLEPRSGTCSPTGGQSGKTSWKRRHCRKVHPSTFNSVTHCVPRWGRVSKGGLPGGSDTKGRCITVPPIPLRGPETGLECPASQPRPSKPQPVCRSVNESSAHLCCKPLRFPVVIVSYTGQGTVDGRTS